MTTTNFTFIPGVLRSPVAKKDMAIEEDKLHLGYKEVLQTFKAAFSMYLVSNKGYKVETVLGKLEAMKNNESAENRKLLTDFIGDGVSVRFVNRVRVLTLVGLTGSDIDVVETPATDVPVEPVVTPPNTVVEVIVTPAPAAPDTTEDQA